MKTPAPQRAAGRKKLAAMGQALPDGTAPIPDVAYLKKAIRAKGRVDPSKWPALKALIVKRAKQLGATNTPGVRGTWAFQAANDGEALEMSSYIAPHLPAGSPAGGQFGTTSGGGGKPTPAQQHAAHDAHMAHLQHLVDIGKATPAQKAELAAKKAAAKKTTTAAATTAAKTATAAKPKAAAKAKAPAKPKVNKTKGTVTATVGGKKVTMTLHQWHQLHVAHEKAIKAANDTEAIEMATATPRKMPMVRGAADVQLRRTGPGMITVQHKSTGMKVGTITPKGNGWQGMHATGTATGASGSQQGALTGLIAFHNKQAAKAKASGFPPAQQDGTAVMPGSKTYTAERDAVDLAGALPVSTPASSSSDGPRVTSMGSGKAAAAPAGSPSGLSPYAAAIYRKFIAKKMKPAVALAFAKRADAMHAKAA